MSTKWQTDAETFPTDFERSGKKWSHCLAVCLWSTSCLSSDTAANASPFKLAKAAPSQVCESYLQSHYCDVPMFLPWAASIKNNAQSECCVPGPLASSLESSIQFIPRSHLMGKTSTTLTAVCTVGSMAIKVATEHHYGHYAAQCTIIILIMGWDTACRAAHT